jgi:hypothetical protein
MNARCRSQSISERRRETHSGARTPLSKRKRRRAKFLAPEYVVVSWLSSRV